MFNPILICIFVCKFMNMRILYITDALAVWGGIERVLSDKINYLVSKYNYKVFVITADQGCHPIPFPLHKSIKVIDLDIRFHQQYQYHGLKRLKEHLRLERLFKDRLRLAIESTKPDVISCIRDGYVAQTLEVHGAIPVIFESHAMYRDVLIEKSTLLHRYATLYSRKRFSKLSGLVSLTQGDAEDWRCVCKNVRVIPNVVHLNNSGKFSTHEEKRVIFAGRFDYQKDIATLLQIWTKVQKKYPDWQLEVYGNGKLKSGIERMTYALGLHVKISPAIPNIFERYIDSSIFVMSSLYEPFGLVLVEAMSCGLPVVAFNCPYGPADIITDGVDGFLVEDRNIQLYADRVCFLIENKEMRKAMGLNAVASSRRFEAEKIMPLWKQLFEEIVVRNK